MKSEGRYYCPQHPDEEEFILNCDGMFQEVGVLVDLRGYPTNRWGDGIAGVPEDVKQTVLLHECAPLCPVCGEETEWREE
jgi:hypothetical protein